MVGAVPGVAAQPLREARHMTAIILLLLGFAIVASLDVGPILPRVLWPRVG